jgi:hypothetical protein
MKVILLLDAMCEPGHVAEYVIIIRAEDEGAKKASLRFD